MKLSVILKTLGDDIHMRILGLLMKKELCVCDIESVLDLSQVGTSRHLAKMKSSGILKSRKSAQWIYYSINEEFITEYPLLYETLSAELKKNNEHKIDLKTLSILKKKGNGYNC